MNYLEDLIKRGLEAADSIDTEFKTTHPFGTVEADVIREMARVIKGYAGTS